MPSSVPIRSSQDLGQLIAAARRRRSLTQRQVAEALGVTQAWISKVERGGQKTRIGQVLRLASSLEIRIAGEIAPPSAKSPVEATRDYPDLDDLLD